MKQILDVPIKSPKGCFRNDCPTDDELKRYPAELDEDHFDDVDERIFHCQKCRRRLDAINIKK